ncbi:cell division protein FtsQ/DivIB [Nafulsella turpanensis]|uniref:cell division protein FtsQ/DivIB n=1 Tax=Nafulsella turpanensis TaxID=1265690 RepID=UPI00034D1043|nr:cell division protein FtsQ/DivIB [Nafulsella turpanensis]
MKVNSGLLRAGKWVLASIAVVGSVGLVVHKEGERSFKKIVINIENQYDNYFVNEADVMHLISAGGTEKILGTAYESLSLKKVENRIKTHKFVNSTEVFKDFRGNLFVNITQNRPLARIIRQYSPHAYISTEGEILPVSERFTARVPLISGPYTDKLVKSDLSETEEGRQVYELLRYIDEDPFWKAQIAQLEIDAKGHIIMYPQVTKQFIEFGKAEQIEQKFKKLKIFYDKILPAKGWNSYRKVNVKYQDQIICE